MKMRETERYSVFTMQHDSKQYTFTKFHMETKPLQVKLSWTVKKRKEKKDNNDDCDDDDDDLLLLFSSACTDRRRDDDDSKLW